MVGNWDQAVDAKAQSNKPASALCRQRTPAILPVFRLKRDAQITATSSAAIFDLISDEAPSIAFDSMLFFDDVSKRTTPPTAKYNIGTISIQVMTKT